MEFHQRIQFYLFHIRLMKHSFALILLVFTTTILAHHDINTMNSKKILDENFIHHGTLLYTTICSDGILMATDSRASFVDELRKPYAYSEESVKMYKVGDYVLSVSEITMLGKRFLRDIIKDFNLHSHKGLSVEETFHQLYEYFNQLEPGYYGRFPAAAYFISGYENGQPKIIGFKEGQKIAYNQIGGAISSDPRLKLQISITQEHEYTTSYVLPKLNLGFNEVSKLEPMIGGPTQIWKIGPDNSIQFINKIKESKYLTYSELAKAIIKNKVKMTYLHPEAKEFLKNKLLEGIRLGL